MSSLDEIGQLARSFNAMADTVDREDTLRQAFAADIAHELRTPLTILQGQLEAVQDGIAQPDPQLIASLHEEAVRMGRLVADLETMAEAGAAGFTLQRREVALHDLVATALDALGARMEERELTVITHLKEVTVLADPVRISQVVTNLLTNAATYTPPGGTITLTLSTDTEKVELEVADTGPGIPAEELPRVFDRFFRGAASPPGGSGIGLAVAAELVAAQGGTITADSPPGMEAASWSTSPPPPRTRTAPSSDLHNAALPSTVSAASSVRRLRQGRRGGTTMRNTNKVRAGIAAAVVALGVGAAGTGVAFATTATPPPAPAQTSPGASDGSPQQDNTANMDQLMAQMVQNLPADQRAAATQMHEQMRPAMQKMMSGNMGATAPMKPGANGGNGMNGGNPKMGG